MRFLFALLALTGLLLAGGSPADAASRRRHSPLSAAAEWRYGQSQIDVDGEETVDNSHFFQQYSVLYEKVGLLQGGRGGSYDFSLGFEWTKLDGEDGDEDIDADARKFLFRGDVLLAPGGLPFRLHLYSHDLARTQEAFNSDDGDSILGINDPVDLYNGTHITTGATLLVGIRNGSYLGRYRDYLSMFPRLLMDYSQTVVHDPDRKIPVHYRNRNLAFVSLNKKDNWFHYRYTDFVDFEEKSGKNNFVEKTWMLGTIDHALMRQWINLTNWLRISADGSYNVRDRALTDTPERSYDLNLFATARRAAWQGGTFTTFQRLIEENDLAVNKTLEVPVFLNGELSRNTSWRFRLIAAGDRHDPFGSPSATFEQTNEENLYASGQIETFRQGRYILAPRLDAEIKRGNQGEGVNARAGLEFYTNSRYGLPHNLFVAYSAARFSGTGEEGDETDFWESDLTARVDYNPGRRVRTGLEQRLVAGWGDLDNTATSYITPQSTLGLDGRENSGAKAGNTFHSITTWFGQYTAPSRLSNRVQLGYDYLSAETGDDDRLTVTHALHYDSRRVRLEMTNEWVLGTTPGQDANLGSDSLGTVGSGATARQSLSHRSSVRYSPGRAWETNAAADAEWRDVGEGSITRWRFDQDYRYSFFTGNGIVRKLAELGEEFEYERVKGVGQAARSETVLTLVGQYFPTKWSRLGLKVSYRALEPEATDEIAAFLTTGLDFEKLQVSFDYGYGTRTAGAVEARRKEHRWDVAVKKVF